MKLSLEAVIHQILLQNPVLLANAGNSAETETTIHSHGANVKSTPQLAPQMGSFEIPIVIL